MVLRAFMIFSYIYACIGFFTIVNVAGRRNILKNDPKTDGQLKKTKLFRPLFVKHAREG